MVSLLLVCSLIAPGITVEKTTFKDWREAVRISNGEIEVVVVPEIGRVMFYGYPGKKNFLWVNPILGASGQGKAGYKDFGGDKVWPIIGSTSARSKESSFDGIPFTFELLKDGVRMTSQLRAGKLGESSSLQLMREIRISDIGTVVRFTNRLQNLGESKTCAMVQAIQLDAPSEVGLLVDPSRSYNMWSGQKLDSKYHQYLAGKLTITRHPTKPFRFGTIVPNGEIAAKVNSEWFVAKCERVRRAVYPDANSSHEVFTNPNPDAFIELLSLSPLLEMGTREMAIQKVEWQVRNRM
jgi:hypothetical protein